MTLPNRPRFFTSLLSFGALALAACASEAPAEEVAEGDSALIQRPLSCYDHVYRIDDPSLFGYDPVAVARGFRFVARGARKDANRVCGSHDETTLSKTEVPTGPTGVPIPSCNPAWCRQETQRDFDLTRCIEMPNAGGEFMGLFALTGNLYDPGIDCIHEERSTWSFTYEKGDAASRQKASNDCEVARRGCTPISSATPPPPASQGRACVKLSRPDLYNAALQEDRNPTQEESHVTCDCVPNNYGTAATWNDDDNCSIVHNNAPATNPVPGQPEGFKWGVWNSWCVSTGRIVATVEAGRTVYKDAAGRTCAVRR